MIPGSYLQLTTDQPQVRQCCLSTQLLCAVGLVRGLGPHHSPTGIKPVKPLSYFQTQLAKQSSQKKNHWLSTAVLLSDMEYDTEYYRDTVKYLQPWWGISRCGGVLDDPVPPDSDVFLTRK